MNLNNILNKTKSGFRFFFESFIWLAVLLFVLDLVTKLIVMNNMTVGQYIPIIPNFAGFEFIYNRGMAFGINFGNDVANRIIFIVISVAGAIALITFFVLKYKTLNKYMKACLALMISGCVGNLIDRSFYKEGVVDFIAFDFGSYHFPRFNVADSCLVIGTIMLIVYLFISEARDSLAKKKKEAPVTSNEKMISKDEEMMSEEYIENKENNDND